ncbi:Major capsid protein Gp5 [uncultured Caudovirales phage]|uniref:Major capsid protein Gp5 n=1 Tax=uncultured Caudovirales phage TaxID=2100421 RepID=A0A6J5RC22_9CAUD|nr:Major capsid protein Gp5 [uncultured Caudovirales phage]|tara:strand:+ start:3636 stop:4742 length:1107 start_codon:yes stop_codon:yes gene_type:complete
MKSIKISRVLLNASLALFVGLTFAAIAAPIGSAFLVTLIVSGVIFASGFIPKTSGTLSMALQTEVWLADITENLYKNNEFILESTSHDGYVVNKTVHVPQAGSKPGVTVNRSSLPASATARTDSDLTYNVDEYSTDPIILTNVDELQISYPKRMSIMQNNINTLNETIGDYVANKWAANTSSTIVRTSGAAGSALAPGATGTRLKLTVTDVANAAKTLDTQNIPREGRVLLLPADMFWELMESSDVLRASYNGFQMNPSVLATGQIAALFGFKIMIRSTVNVFTNAGTPVLKAVGAATAVTDNYGAIAYHPSVVAKAKGGVSLFSQSGDNTMGDPTYYGVIMSALVMLGAKMTRSTGYGVVNLVQAAS